MRSLSSRSFALKRSQSSAVSLVFLFFFILASEQKEDLVQLPVGVDNAEHDRADVAVLHLGSHATTLSNDASPRKTLSRPCPRARPAPRRGAPPRPSRRRRAPRTRASSQGGRRPGAPTRPRDRPRFASCTRRRSRRTRGRQSRRGGPRR